MTVDIIVPFYNQSDLMRRCLRSVDEALPPGQGRLILVDDSSEAGEAQRVRCFAERLRRPMSWLGHDLNLGFRAAVLSAMSVAEAAHVILLNSDTIATAGFIDKLLQPMVHDMAVKAVAPVTNARNDLFQFRRCLRLARGENLASRIAEEASRLERAQTDICTESYYLTGSCLALDRAAFEDAGLFDPAYVHGLFRRSGPLLSLATTWGAAAYPRRLLRLSPGLRHLPPFR